MLASDVPVSKKRKKRQAKPKPHRPGRTLMEMDDPSGQMVTRTFKAVLPLAQRELPDLLHSILPDDVSPGTVLDPMAAAEYLHVFVSSLRSLPSNSRRRTRQQHGFGTHAGRLGRPSAGASSRRRCPTMP
jgi:hypothetical protein